MQDASALLDGTSNTTPTHAIETAGWLALGPVGEVRLRRRGLEHHITRQPCGAWVDGDGASLPALGAIVERICAIPAAKVTPADPERVPVYCPDRPTIDLEAHDIDGRTALVRFAIGHERESVALIGSWVEAPRACSVPAVDVESLAATLDVLGYATRNQ